ncbi:hypothetical protein CRG98_047615, partial [Punica granatum]
MDIFTHDLSLFGFNLSDQMMESLSQRHDSPQSSPSTSAALPGPGDDSNPRAAKAAAPASPPPHRHDGKSPLPLGMDWSLPPSKWEGRNTVWPHDPRTGWSYCVTIPSWTILPKSSGSEPVVLKKEFPMKMLPPTPPKKLLRNKSRILLDERRCSLEDWMEKLLSDIDLSRTATVANFLELEAAARSAFHDINEQNSDWNSTTTDVYPSIAFPPASDPSVGAASPSIMSDIGNDSSYEVSELGSPRRAQNISGDFSAETSEHELAGRKDTLKYGVFNKKFTGEDGSNVRGKKVLANTIMVRYQDEEIPSEADSFKPNNHARRLSTESIASDLSSIRASEVSNFGIPNLFASSTLDHPEDSEAVGIVDSVSSVSQMRRDFVIAFPLEERQKLNRMLTTARQRLSTAKTDMEDIIARFNQEVAVRQFLQTK